MADDMWELITRLGMRHRTATASVARWRRPACGAPAQPHHPDRRDGARDCKRCFPSSDASLGAAEGEQQ